MVDLKKLRYQIIELVDQRNNNWLQIERARTSDSQFAASRRLYLDELGKNGLKADISDLFLNTSLSSLVEDNDDDLDQPLPF